MSAAEVIAVIRDIFLIVTSGVAIMVLLVTGYLLLRLYPLIKRATQNVEQSSAIILNLVSHPLNLIGAVVDLISRGLGMVDQFRKRDRREDDEQIK